MAQTPEGKVKYQIDKVLKACGPQLYSFKPVQAGYGAPALDYHCCYHGVAFFIEAKAPGKKPTKRQNMTMEKIGWAGGKIFIIDGAEGVAELARWLEMVHFATCNGHTALPEELYGTAH